VVIVGGLLALVVTIIFMFALRPVAEEVGLVDIPGGRKRHGERVPVIGGIAMVMGLAFGASLVDTPALWQPVMLSIYLLIVVGVIDDRFDLPAGVRLIAQTGACLLAIFAADLQIAHLGAPLFFEAPLGPFAPMFTILVILSVINAFNVVDGIDGLAGGLAFVAFAAMAIIGFDSDVFPLTVLMLTVISGYLLFNLPLNFNRPVRAFMGDAGSTFLGLSIACIGMALSQGPAAKMTPVIGLWLAAVPIYDLFSTFMRRLIMGKSPFVPDQEHLHHMLMAEGLSSRKTLIYMVALAVLCAAFGVYGDIAGFSDGVMFSIWAAGGVAYYHMMRYPKRTVAAIEGLLAVTKKARAPSA
jgi:UDP-GlcNAc:undecaprenyl-phosphate GlcNAc-1-phosphate transferase